MSFDFLTHIAATYRLSFSHNAQSYTIIRPQLIVSIRVLITIFEILYLLLTSHFNFWVSCNCFYMMSLSEYLDLYFHPSLIFLLMLQTYFDISNPSPSLEPTQEATWSRSAISSTPSCIEPHLIPTFTVIDFLLPLLIHSQSHSGGTSDHLMFLLHLFTAHLTPLYRLFLWCVCRYWNENLL